MSVAYVLPWSFDVACVSMIFMLLEYLMNHYRINWLHNDSKSVYYISIAILLFFILISINDTTDLNKRHFSNLLFVWIEGLLGTYVTIEFSKKISMKDNYSVRLFVFLGKIL